MEIALTTAIRHRPGMRRLPELAGLLGDGAGAVGAAAGLRPADGGRRHQRDGGEGRQVPPPHHPAVGREARQRPAEGALG